jgi:hypothetical protein
MENQELEGINHYDIDEVIDRFEINKMQSCAILTKWLEQAKGALKPFQGAMILGQAMNADDKPIYGSWVQGVNWRFTTLKDSEYCVSRIYDASQPKKLKQIVFI